MFNNIKNKNNALDPSDLEKVTGGIVKNHTTEETSKDSEGGVERLNRNGENPFFLHH